VTIDTTVVRCWPASSASLLIAIASTTAQA
jgi:hypothetical protein